jgi:hypothetical protein
MSAGKVRLGSDSLFGFWWAGWWGEIGWVEAVCNWQKVPWDEKAPVLVINEYPSPRRHERKAAAAAAAAAAAGASAIVGGG